MSIRKNGLSTYKLPKNHEFIINISTFVTLKYRQISTELIFPEEVRLGKKWIFPEKIVDNFRL